tara:strand:+ start:1943 stop:2212 length:270 start_codon:yes stop_codon:yes gene_type:complete
MNEIQRNIHPRIFEHSSGGYNLAFELTHIDAGKAIKDVVKDLSVYVVTWLVINRDYEKDGVREVFEIRGDYELLKQALTALNKPLDILK